jgi:hypothetical protein
MQPHKGMTMDGHRKRSAPQGSGELRRPRLGLAAPVFPGRAEPQLRKPITKRLADAARPVVRYHDGLERRR